MPYFIVFSRFENNLWNEDNILIIITIIFDKK